MNCPHCGHAWSAHNWHRERSTCQECGCMWRDPSTIPPPPEPRPARDQLIATIENVMWTELERQAEEESFGPYVDRDDPCIDGNPDMTAVAAAVAELFVDSQDDCSHCHGNDAISSWKNCPREGDAE